MASRLQEIPLRSTPAPVAKPKWDIAQGVGGEGTSKATTSIHCKMRQGSTHTICYSKLLSEELLAMASSAFQVQSPL